MTSTKLLALSVAAFVGSVSLVSSASASETVRVCGMGVLNVAFDNIGPRLTNLSHYAQFERFDGGFLLTYEHEGVRKTNLLAVAATPPLQLLSREQAEVLAASGGIPVRHNVAWKPCQ